MKVPLKTPTPKHLTPTRRTRVRRRTQLKHRAISERRYSARQATRRRAQRRKSNRWASPTIRKLFHWTLVYRRRMSSRESRCWSSLAEHSPPTRRRCRRWCRSSGHPSPATFSFIASWLSFRPTFVHQCFKLTTLLRLRPFCSRWWRKYRNSESHGGVCVTLFAY